MTRLEALEQEVTELKRRLDTLTRELFPTPADIEATVDELVRRLGPDGAAEEINRRYRLGRPL